MITHNSKSDLPLAVAEKGHKDRRVNLTLCQNRRVSGTSENELTAYRASKLG